MKKVCELNGTIIQLNYRKILNQYYLYVSSIYFKRVLEILKKFIYNPRVFMLFVFSEYFCILFLLHPTYFFIFWGLFCTTLNK